MPRPNHSNFNLKDKRTYQARRLNTLRQSFAEQFPQDLTAAQDALLTQAATFALLAEREAARIVEESPDADPNKFTRYSDKCTSLLVKIGANSQWEAKVAGGVSDTKDPMNSESTNAETNLIASILA